MLDMGKPVAQRLVIGADHQPVHPRRPVQSGAPGVEPGAGEAGRQHAGFGGEAGMERLGHRAELRHEARRHAGRDRHRMGRLLRIQLQQPRARRRRPDRADRRGGVPAPVAVHRVHPLADPPEDLEARDISIDTVPPRRPFRLGQRKNGGNEHGGRMRLGRIEIVVEVERMRRRAVHQRSPGWRQRPPEPDRRRRPFTPRRHRREHPSRDRLHGPGDRNPDHIDELPPRRLHGGLGPIIRRLGKPAAVGESGGIGHGGGDRGFGGGRELRGLLSETPSEL